MASLGALTALRNLKFDLAPHHSMSDDALRQLARLRLTSLSLPGLRLVIMDVGMHVTHLLVSHLACRGQRPPSFDSERPCVDTEQTCCQAAQP